MIRITYRANTGEEYIAEAAPGMSVMEAALAGGVPEILGLCGGICSCATCHVHVDPNWMGRVAPAEDEERAMLEAIDNAAPTSRLGCQVKLDESHDGLVVHVFDLS
jgi:ferredoxin, 2Fe-2S